MSSELKITDVFNQETACIFTDASIVKLKIGGFDGCSGTVAFKFDDENVVEDISLVKLLNTTNNEAEAYAIYLGLLQAIKIRNYSPQVKNFILFADSKISLIGLREWVYKWVNNVSDGVMMSSSGKPVANQGIFLRCIKLIMDNDLNITLCHIDGHVKFDVKKEVYQAIINFRSVNHMTNYFIDMQLYEKIARCNDIVDNASRDELVKSDYLEGVSNRTKELMKGITDKPVVISINQVPTICLKNSAFTHVYAPFDIEKYKRLTGGIINGTENTSSEDL